MLYLSKNFKYVASRVRFITTALKVLEMSKEGSLRHFKKIRTCPSCGKDAVPANSLSWASILFGETRCRSCNCLTRVGHSWKNNFVQSLVIGTAGNFFFLLLIGVFVAHYLNGLTALLLVVSLFLSGIVFCYMYPFEARLVAIDSTPRQLIWRRVLKSITLAVVVFVAAVPLAFVVLLLT